MTDRRTSFQYMGIEAVICGVVECVNDVEDVDTLITVASGLIYDGNKVGYGAGTDGSFQAIKDQLITKAGGNPTLYRKEADR